MSERADPENEAVEQLTEPIERAVKNGGIEEEFAALVAAVNADVDEFLRRGDANAQDFEALERTAYDRAIAAADRIVKALRSQMR